MHSITIGNLTRRSYVGQWSRGDCMTRETTVEDIEFPVGNDPTEPETIRYWEEVVRRIRLAPLPDELGSWADAIHARIDGFYVTRQQLAEAIERLDAAELSQEEVTAAEVGMAKAQREYNIAVFEFERVKWKLSSSWKRYYKLDSPAIRLLFGPRTAGKTN